MSWSHLLTGIVAVPLGITMVIKHRAYGDWYVRAMSHVPVMWQGVLPWFPDDEVARAAGFSAIPAGCIAIIFGVIEIAKGLP